MDEALAHFVLRAALDNSYQSSNLILEGVFTIASLLLHGRAQSLEHRSRLIIMLQKTLHYTDRDSVLQNLVATMLLYQYEVYVPTPAPYYLRVQMYQPVSNIEQLLTATKPQVGWRFFLCGAKKIISTLIHKTWLYQDDSIILMDWIYYHEVSSEFSLRHWADSKSITSFCKVPLAGRYQELAFRVPAVSFSRLLFFFDCPYVMASNSLCRNGITRVLWMPSTFLRTYASDHQFAGPRTPNTMPQR